MPDDAPTLYSSCGFLGFGKKVAPPPESRLQDLQLLRTKKELCQNKNDIPWCAELPAVSFESLRKKMETQTYELGRDFLEPLCEFFPESACAGPCKFEGERCVSNYGEREAPPVLYSSCGFLGFNKKKGSYPLSASEETILLTMKGKLCDGYNTGIDLNHLPQCRELKEKWEENGSRKFQNLHAKAVTEYEETIGTVYDSFCRSYDEASCPLRLRCKVEGDTCVFNVGFLPQVPL